MHKSPIRLEDFALTYGLSAFMEDEGLRERLRRHPRVEWNSKLDLFTYKPEHDLRSPRDLIKLLKQRYTSETTRCAGMKLSELRESYPQAKEAVEDFANKKPREDREVLVLRGKDTSAKMVFWNEFQGEQARGPDEGERASERAAAARSTCIWMASPSNPSFPFRVSRRIEFKDLWHSIKVPDAVDLARSLENGEHLNATIIHSCIPLTHTLSRRSLAWQTVCHLQTSSHRRRRARRMRPAVANVVEEAASVAVGEPTAASCRIPT